MARKFQNKHDRLSFFLDGALLVQLEMSGTAKLGGHQDYLFPCLETDDTYDEAPCSRIVTYNVSKQVQSPVSIELTM